MKLSISTFAASNAKLLVSATLLVGANASAQVGPDITVLKLAGTSGADVAEYGQSNGIYAYSFGTTSCNPGTQPVDWTSADHPVIAQNFLRLKEGRFEQIGQSWLKHGFCAVNESGCGSCQATPCDSLGMGCADTYSSGLNDGRYGAPKYMVNPTTGLHTETSQNPVGDSLTRGRLQVAAADIDPALNAGAVWFAEAQYVSAHEYQAGNGRNSVSYRRLNVSSPSNINSSGATVVGSGAPHAWQSVDPAVTVREVVNPDEGGAGVHGHFLVGYKVTDLGGGLWRYNYIVENLTSDQGGGSWSVPVPSGITLTNLYFNDVAYHSGEPQDGTDWTTSQVAGSFTWSVAAGSDNALRWSTTYSFGFDADAAPGPAQAQLGLHDPGTGVAVAVDVEAPGGVATSVGTGFCFGDGTGAACPCNNNAGAGRGCQNSGSQGALLSATGTPSVSNDTLVLNIDGAVAAQPGLFFQGTAALNGGLGVSFGDGLRCAGGNVRRLGVAFPDGAGNASSSMSISLTGAVSAGDTLRYQFWYRDPVFSPCLSAFNLSNGLELNWLP